MVDAERRSGGEPAASDEPDQRDMIFSQSRREGASVSHSPNRSLHPFWAVKWRIEPQLMRKTL